MGLIPINESLNIIPAGARHFKKGRYMKKNDLLLLNIWLIVVLFGTLLTTGADAFSRDKKQDQKEAIEKADGDAQTSEIEKASKKELELKACGESEINFSTKTDKKQHPKAEAQAGQAIIYVIRHGMMGNKVQTKLAMDGKWLGANRGNNYFYFTAAPGEHAFPRERKIGPCFH